MATRSVLGILLLSLAGGVACTPVQDAKNEIDSILAAPLPNPVAFRDGSLDGGTIRRLLVLPFADGSSVGAQTDTINAAMRDELIKLRRFDVVRPESSDATSKPEQGPKQTGRISTATIIELGRRYGVDAVVFGTIDHFRPYSPPSLGVSASMVDIQTGKIIWEVRDFLDAADRTCEVAMNQFFDSQMSREQTVMNREIMSASPAWFSRFAAKRIADTLLPPPPPPTAAR